MRYKDIEGQLYNYNTIKIRISKLNRDIESLAEGIVSLGGASDGMPRGTDISNPTANNAMRLIEIKAEKEAQLSKDKKAEMVSNNQPTADFINVVVWGRQAENANAYLEKGSQVAVSGRIQTSSYEAQDGTKRYKTEIVADRIEFLTPASKNKQQPEATQESMDGIEGFYKVDDTDLPF